MKNILSLLFALCTVSLLSAQTAAPSKYTVMFYNVENVFDTIDTPDVSDSEFTPNGAKEWTGAKYHKKMANLEKVFYGIASHNKTFPTVIGVCETENRNVLEDIAMLPKLAPANYEIVHYDCPYYRGVDAAFLYNPTHFKLKGSHAYAVKDPERPTWTTRDIVSMWGEIEGELFYFFVGHWPSRLGGEAASAHLRGYAAATTRHAIDSIQGIFPDAKFIVMGDLNDDPNNDSVYKILGAKGHNDELVKGDLFNPFYQMHQDGLGTLVYRGIPNLFDNIIVSENILNAEEGKLKLAKGDKKPYYGNIYDRKFLRQQKGAYKGTPFRTFIGNNFVGGFSDHLPVYINIEK